MASEADQNGGARTSEDEERRQTGPISRALGALHRADTSASALNATRALRGMLPGDSRLGDELSTAGEEPSQAIARYIAEAGSGERSATRDVGLGVLQVWQSLSESAGRGRGTEDIVILFTDLVDFSKWALEVGDERALELLRSVAAIVEPAVADGGGRVIKRLGDGHMAAFPDARRAVATALAVQQSIDAVDVEGHRPVLRCGVHCGRPRKVGGDYLGVDVNIAARVAEAARGGEVLISNVVLDSLDKDAFEVKRRRRFRAKGTPREIHVYAVKPRDGVTAAAQS